jgi:uncharacterized membrane protein (DUF106 family)
METEQAIILMVFSLLFALSWGYTLTSTLKNINLHLNPIIVVLCSIMTVFIFMVCLGFIVMTTTELNELRKKNKQAEPKYEKVTEVLYRKKI